MSNDVFKNEVRLAAHRARTARHGPYAAEIRRLEQRAAEYRVAMEQIMSESLFERRTLRAHEAVAFDSAKAALADIEGRIRRIESGLAPQYR